MDVHLYDTTLRDGSQREGITLSLEDKLRIAGLLDDFGVSYIEGGWPGSNPKDAEFLAKAQLKNAKLVAFGSTRRPGRAVDQDANLRMLLEVPTPAVALVGKASIFHVKNVLETTPEENLAMIGESVRHMKEEGREVIFDAEHFFDGYIEDPEYALETLHVAEKAGVDWLALCDTNGGQLPCTIGKITKEIRKATKAPLGIHAHNDGETAVANSLAAVAAGATMVQGTINGYGERCGNANLVSLVPALQIKLKMKCVPEKHLKELTLLARRVSEFVNLPPDPHAPYVGASAFAHKGGIHVAAVEKSPASYEHLTPEAVGNHRRVLISELSGRGNVRMLADELGLDLAGTEKEVLRLVKEMEAKGFQFEAAEGSFELLIRRCRPGYVRPYDILNATVFAEQRAGIEMKPEASVKVKVEGEIRHVAAVGNGPVNALDAALRKALRPTFPFLKETHLTDYKVRILDPDRATGATTRVLLEAACGTTRWWTVGCSANIVEASLQALSDSLELHILRTRDEAGN